MFLLEEAEICRGLAADFEGKAEGPFLLKAAHAFEELAVDGILWLPAARLNRAPRAGTRLF